MSGKGAKVRRIEARRRLRGGSIRVMLRGYGDWAFQPQVYLVGRNRKRQLAHYVHTEDS